MKFNYGLEKKKFDERWKRLREEYIQAGWDEESIQLMYEFDYEEFKRERVFCKHNQYLDEVLKGWIEIEEGRMPQLFKKYKDYSIEISINPDKSRYGWLEEIGDRELYEVLKSLPLDYLELITQLAIDELKQVEIAMRAGVSGAAVSKKVAKIRKKLEILRNKG